MDDVRYSELLFLRALAKESTDFQHFNPNNPAQLKAVGLGQTLYIEMAILLLEDMCIRFDDERCQLLVARLRGEIGSLSQTTLTAHSWDNPRREIQNTLLAQNVQRLRITYRGLRRIQELSDVLRADRIIEPHGVLLSMQYFRRDLEDALRRSSEAELSLLFADLDDFKSINKEFGHESGNIVMKRYLEIVRDALGIFGTAYRGIGDEVTGIVVGQGHERAVQFAEDIRAKIEAMRCERDGIEIPHITVSIGVATSPPGPRSPDIETVADDRGRQAKNAGKNRVVSE